MSIRTVTRIFHNNKLTLLRPRAIPAKGDISLQQAFFDDLRNKIQQAGPTDRFLFFDADPEKARKGYKMVLEKGSVIDYNLKIKHIFGNLTPVLYNASVLKDENGHINGIFAAARDSPELNRLLKQEILFKILFEHMNEGVALHQLIFDANHNPINYKILNVNQSYERILDIKQWENVWNG